MAGTTNFDMMTGWNHLNPISITERLGLEGASLVVSSLKQKNVDEAVEKLKAKGIVCYVSNAQQRKNLIDKTVQVSN
ncbi:hypothetical protein Q3G72_029475 [Acer saccharum]|nr:hypothetical protein Q3G72_029475 [Acer saccharum]